MERIPIAVCATLLATAATVGLPLRLARTLAEWRDRDYAPVEGFVTAGLRPEDHVYVSFAAYYPAKRIAEVVFLPPYRRMMRPEEKAGVTVLVVAPREAGDAQTFMGGAWREVARLGHGQVMTVVDRLQLRIFGQATAKYDLATYRRQEERTGSS